MSDDIKPHALILEHDEPIAPSEEALSAAMALIAQLQHEPVDPTDDDIVPTACALDVFAARAVAAERERCLRIIREEFAAEFAAIAKAKGTVVRDFFASLALVIRRGER